MSASESDNPMHALRDHLFRGEEIEVSGPAAMDQLKQLVAETENSHRTFSAWKKLRDLGAAPNDQEARDVLGVVGEIGTRGGSALIFGLKDGSASLYTSTGGGVIGGGGHERVRNACRRLVEQAQAFTAEFPVVSEFPFPESGQFRCSLLTPRGVQALSVQQSEVSSGNHRLSPLFVSWNYLVTQLRLSDPKEYAAASSRSANAYVNCLLTMMWEKSLDPMKITPGQPVPDLKSRATTPKDHKFLEEIELPCDEINAATVISILKNLSGLRWYRWFTKQGVIQVKLAQPNRLIDVSFEVQETKDDQHQKCLLLSRCSRT